MMNFHNKMRLLRKTLAINRNSSAVMDSNNLGLTALSLEFTSEFSTASTVQILAYK